MADDFKRRYAGGQRDFRNSNLVDLDLSGTTLEDIQLNGSTLTRVDFRGGVLHRADLSDVVTTDGDWSGVRLEEVRLVDASLGSTIFNRARFERCVFERTSFATSPLREAWFIECDLKDVDFSDAELVQAVLKRARFARVQFGHANLAHCVLSQAVLGKAECALMSALEADLSEVDASGVRFESCELPRTSFKHATLTGSRFSGCDLEGTDFSEADLRGADLRGQSKLISAKLDGARYDHRTVFPTDFDARKHGLKWVGESPRSSVAPSRMTRQAFEARFGAPELLRDATDALRMCRRMAPGASRAEQPSIFDGAVYTTGYYRAGVDPRTVDHDWTALAEALTLEQELQRMLAGCYESSALDVPYFPLVVAPPAIGPANEQDFLIERLGLSSAFQEHPPELYWGVEGVEEFENAFVAEEDFTPAELAESYDPQTLEAYRRATSFLKQKLDAPARYALQDENSIYSVRPVFWAGRSRGSIFVGVFTVRQDD